MNQAVSDYLRSRGLTPNDEDHAFFDELIKEAIAKSTVSEPPFRVHVQEMKESHQVTYWVCLDQGSRALDAMPWDEGRITPFKTAIKAHCQMEAKEWADFLGVKVLN